MNASGVRRLRAAAWLAGAVTVGAQAQDQETDLSQAIAESAIVGPAHVELRDQAAIDLDAEVAFIPRPVADQVMNAAGNVVGEEFIGLILPTAEGEEWFVTVDYIDSGYIADDDARDWDVDELLESLEQGTRDGNRWREQRGFAPIEITGWIQRPEYDSSRHQLVWSAGVRDIGAPESEEQGVNYNTYVLGREGYLSLDLVTSESAIAGQQDMIHGLLQATHFNAGLAYTDFDSSTDRVAAYGLAALVGGVAAKKLGLLAVVAAFLVKGWKLVVVGGVALAAMGRKLMGRKNA